MVRFSTGLIGLSERMSHRGTGRYRYHSILPPQYCYMSSISAPIPTQCPTVGQIDSDHPGIKWLNSLAQWKGRGGFGLEKTKSIHERLGSPGDSFPSFHVTGTNGKGSVSCNIAAILGARGFKVGLYSSPHLVQLNERVVIDGESVDYDVLGDACIEVKNASEGTELSFFEAITLASFLVFRNKKVDFAVIEVGIGGRLDSTNVILKPLACVITTIELDHENILGTTLAEIAHEKAGIIKSGSPVITGRIGDEAARVIAERATDNIVLQLGRDFLRTPQSKLEIAGDSFALNAALSGDHQLDNLAVAQAAIYSGLQVGELSSDEKAAWGNAFAVGASNVYWPNRLESIVWRHKNVTLDSAHNPAGIRSLISFLDTEIAIQKFDFVFGVVGTKRWQEMLELLLPYAGTFHLVLPDFADPVPLVDIQRFLTEKQINSICYDSIEDLPTGLDRSTAQHVVCCGSMYLTGRLRSIFDVAMRSRWKRIQS